MSTFRLPAVLSVEVLARAVCGNKINDSAELVQDGTITFLKILDGCYEVCGLKLNDENKERNQKPFGLE